MADQDTKVAGVAGLVRELRKRKGMTLQQLAEGIGRSVGFVSQLERGISHLAVDDLVAISQVLGVAATYFFSDHGQPASPWLTRPGERRAMTYANGVADELISPRLGGPFFMLETRLEPGAHSGERDLLDSSEQGGYVLEGELTLWLEETEHRLRPGDGFQIPAHVPCRYANQAQTPVRLLWVYA
ncbi:helix-turn-helix domain-containing protein [Silvimonas iriomotensis]|uniref:Transcriptional regulator n=1 Tax=Silvimonas iriomotensis TaxID=449662 RepID=A0ABQ2P9P1_9NEIS|nr:XRE family transcriptional regulator [Silvimonas iriomotensis]GGP21569.1 transcriptional regulator [Silvimonas iriomotensis]